MRGLWVLALAAFVALLMVGPTTAPAVDWCAAHGDDVACVKEAQEALDSCDREADGHRIRAWGEDYPGYQFYGEWDNNGANSGCDRVWRYQKIWSARACEEVAGCGAWVSEP